ncbi:hypothetical protein FOCG_13979 [Fusarium oxysporum f. sp. radicis-lycopersici 26381]|uniref:Uncharacterized protein n=1 Tax=Fusarium oxysporum Fo47 TaxID=660027 RepID=W9L481_FUSOX|nr:hypothetical protein FOZG_01592 [Fusarium oxysporum Fo47]EWZ90989.1 hypothetical protein FOWG_06741 [Fusarium oxysporum f. sp. lycopersici MN25]EXL43579.1 hypothetical protein FOCG_13979 [Fusarium oxysporum f. sp. radicis-lycopersici 26381]
MRKHYRVEIMALWEQKLQIGDKATLFMELGQGIT